MGLEYSKSCKKAGVEKGEFCRKCDQTEGTTAHETSQMMVRLESHRVYYLNMGS